MKRVHSPFHICKSNNLAKNGARCEVEIVKPIIEFINEKCWNLKFKGLMAIGTCTNDADKVRQEYLVCTLSSCIFLQT